MQDAAPVSPQWFGYVGAVEALLTLLLGAFVGFGLTGLQSYLDRRRRRISLSSALLIEMRTLEHAISLRYNNKDVGHSRGRIMTPVFEKFSGDLLLLRHDQLYHVLQFYGFIADINQHLDNARTRLAVHEELGPEVHERIRAKAQYALGCIKYAKSSLEEAGGVLPARLPEHGTRPKTLPPAPPKSFDNYPGNEDDDGEAI